MSLHTLTRVYCSHGSSVAITVFVSYRQHCLNHWRWTSLQRNSRPHLRSRSWAMLAHCATSSILCSKPPRKCLTISSNSTVLYSVVQIWCLVESYGGDISTVMRPNRIGADSLLHRKKGVKNMAQTSTADMGTKFSINWFNVKDIRRTRDKRMTYICEWPPCNCLNNTFTNSTWICSL